MKRGNSSPTNARLVIFLMGTGATVVCWATLAFSNAGAAQAVPLVAALSLLPFYVYIKTMKTYRGTITIGIGLLTVLGWSYASAFSSESSTAGIYLFNPILFGLPLVGIGKVVELTLWKGDEHGDRDKAGSPGS
jgi:hypothetical protein